MRQITKNTIKKSFLNTFEKLFTGILIGTGIALGIYGAFSFQTSSVSPSYGGTGTTDDKNTSKYAPMLTKSGGTFDRNNMSLEAIANALGLPSVGSSKRIFLTSTVYTGNMGWVAGADANCQTRATARSLGGTWKALISSSTSDAKTRLNITYSTTTNLNGEVIAFNPLKTGLFGLWKAKTNAAQYEIKWPLIQDDLWVYQQQRAFWSNTDKDGIYQTYDGYWGHAACANWSNTNYSTSTSTDYGGIGYFGTPGQPGYGFDGDTFFNVRFVSAYGIPTIPANWNSSQSNGDYSHVSWQGWGYATFVSYPYTYGSRNCSESWPLLCQEQ